MLIIRYDTYIIRNPTTKIIALTINVISKLQMHIPINTIYNNELQFCQKTFHVSIKKHSKDNGCNATRRRKHKFSLK